MHIQFTSENKTCGQEHQREKWTQLSELHKFARSNALITVMSTERPIN